MIAVEHLSSDTSVGGIDRLPLLESDDSDQYSETVNLWSTVDIDYLLYAIWN